MKVVLVFVFVMCGCKAQDVFETVEAVVGHSAELPCNVTADLEEDKLNILAWYKNGSATAFYSRDLRGGVETAHDASGRYWHVRGGALDRLQIAAVVPSDAGLYHCLADFAASPAHKTYIQLNVIEPPRNLWVIQENGTQVAKTSAGVNVSQNIGPYYVGDTVHLFCVALGGSPQASLSWRTERRVLKETYTALSEHRVRSDLMYGPLVPEDHGRVLTCQARNNDRTSPLTIDVVVDMFVPPELVSLRVEGHAGGRVKAGEVLDARCRVFGARPAPPITWRLGDQLLELDENVTMDSSQQLVVSQLSLPVGREHDEASLSCCAPSYARADDSLVCAQKLPLTVLYPPVLQIITESDLVDNETLVVSKGEDVLMVCSFQANPAIYQLIWFHEDDIVNEKKYSVKKVQAILELTSVSESDAGEYVCAGTNDEGSSYSEPVRLNVTYPPYCEDESIAEYGVGEGESINITCNVKANPAPSGYRWVLVNAAVNVTNLKYHAHTTIETTDNVLLYERPNQTTYSTIFCWGVNEVTSKKLAAIPCTFLVTDETAPRPLTDCTAVKDLAGIFVKCVQGHDGGLPQKFKFIVKAVESNDSYLSITTMEPTFVISEPKYETYKFVISAFNDKGESQPVEIAKDEITDVTEVPEVSASAVSDITTLSLALCGGVLLVALAACGLVLCARDDRAAAPRYPRHPPPQDHTQESNCEMYASDDDSECVVRRTDSFRRAVAVGVGRYPAPSPGFDVRRTGSFHSARYMEQAAEPARAEPLRHNCRVHSLQNISRKRDDGDHLVLHLPPDDNYTAPRPMNTFYTVPRKSRQKAAKEISDEVSVITQTSDGFSLPPPPDEFGTYRAGTRIRDIPKTTPTYTPVKRNNSTTKEQARQHYTHMSPMNAVGIPTASGTHNAIYAYSDDGHQNHHQDDQELMSYLPSYLTRESGF